MGKKRKRCFCDCPPIARVRLRKLVEAFFDDLKEILSCKGGQLFPSLMIRVRSEKRSQLEFAFSALTVAVMGFRVCDIEMTHHSANWAHIPNISSMCTSYLGIMEIFVNYPGSPLLGMFVIMCH